MKRIVHTIAVLTVLGLAAAPLGAAEDDTVGPVVETLQVDVGDTVAVTGKALFASAPETIGESGTMSNPTAAPGLGMDLAAATVTRTGQNRLVFDVAVHDMPPTGSGVPEIVHYDWDFAVSRNGTHLADFTLNAIGSSQYRQPGSFEPSFQLLTCAPDPDTGQDSCSTAGDLQGEFHEGGLRFVVPTSQILVRDGGVLTQTYDGVAASYGASGLQWYLLGDRMPIDDLTVHPAIVSAGIAPAGTDDAAVALAPAALQANGSYSANLTRPEQPGEYKVVVEACLGPALCDVRTTLVGIG